jgi:chromosomal replication initiator protein
MISPPGIWDGVLRRLAGELPIHTLAAWLEPLVAEADGEGIRLVCPSSFHRDRVRDRFLPLITQGAAQEAGRPLPITLVLAERHPRTAAGRGAGDPPRQGAAPHADETSTPGAAGEGGAASLRRDGFPGGAEPRGERGRTAPRQRAFSYTFGTFVVGPCNALAREASFAVAHGRQQPLNPLYLASKPGLGKTHLARAIVSEARASGNQRALYAPAETFTNEFTASIRSKQMERFKRRFRNGCDLLVVEDVQFLGSKTATQLELFHTLSHLLDAGVRVVLSGDQLPRNIEDLEPRLRSQMMAGLVAEIEPPDALVRREILRSKAASGGVRLPDDCLDRLVEATRGSVRDLEGVLIQLVASSSLLGRPIDLELTEAALHKLFPSRREASRIDPTTVIEIVAAFFRTTPEALASRSRRRDVLVPRQLAMYLCRRYTDSPTAAIARAFGRKHPAVANAVSIVERGILERAPLRYQVEAISMRLEALRRDSQPG